MVEDVSPEQIKRVAEKALVIERYILERAWGLCYAAVAAEIVLIPFLPLIILFLGLSAGYFLVVAIVVNTAVSIVGAAMVAWIFKKAYNSMLVRPSSTCKVRLSTAVRSPNFLERLLVSINVNYLWCRLSARIANVS